MKTRKSIPELLKLPQRIHRGYLAEAYDGIGQYVMVTLTRGSTSAAYKARIAAGDFGGGRTFPVGTPVPVFSIRGQLEILLGNLPGCFPNARGKVIDSFSRVESNGLGISNWGSTWDGTGTYDNARLTADGNNAVFDRSLPGYVDTNLWYDDTVNPKLGWPLPQDIYWFLEHEGPIDPAYGLNLRFSNTVYVSFFNRAFSPPFFPGAQVNWQDSSFNTHTYDDPFNWSITKWAFRIQIELDQVSYKRWDSSLPEPDWMSVLSATGIGDELPLDWEFSSNAKVAGEIWKCDCMQLAQ